MLSEKQKKIIRFGAWLLKKKLGECATTEAIKDDMLNCPNPLFQVIAELMYDAASKSMSGWQQKIIGEVGTFALWVMYKDTAYRDVLCWILKELKDRIENDPEFSKQIDEMSVDPEDWYVNLWIKSRRKTKEARQKGEIPEYDKSLEESIFTPSEQKKRLSKL